MYVVQVDFPLHPTGFSSPVEQYTAPWRLTRRGGGGASGEERNQLFGWGCARNVFEPPKLEEPTSASNPNFIDT